jgi:hypothetical protein
MGTTYGNAKRARKLALLFEKWRRASDAQDYAAMQSARQAIDAVIADQTSPPWEAEQASASSDA